ncbi:hypothetical protein I552_3360 [Mycobacterium xenopi 3993]|nr:hypothetical protein I552_3360 [Mycobacterium xenopi 3993]
MWDLAHIGQQEELWLLRGGDPHRPGMLPADVEVLYDAFVYSRASRADLPLLSRPRRGRFAVPSARLRWTPWTPHPTSPTRTSSSAWWSATNTSTTKPCCRR